MVDESQNIKNPAAQQTRAVKSIPAGAAIAMSGTPVENRLLEYWSVMDLVNRGYLGPAKRFEEQFGKPIQVDGDEQAAERFRRVTAPFILRRLKSDKGIISDLPDKISQDQYCEFTADQAAVYETVVREAMQVIEGTSDTFERQGLVLQMILALKQVCNHPAQYLKQASAGDRRLRQGPAPARAARRRPPPAREGAGVHPVPRDGRHPAPAGSASTSAAEPAFLHGGVARKRRDAMVSRFQEHPYERVLLLSLKAGGTGLNLTAASQVIHYDLWWNPAVENQATDRAYRIGQTRTVQVHRLLTRDTFEERINDMIQAKRGLAEMTVGTGEQWIGQLERPGAARAVHAGGGLR
ncbi:MAG: DEAD/DEAH box helicase [Anaerolineales bacterium]|nr:DEAD/DEAH box helicase [Anaerolineales bacterium]